MTWNDGTQDIGLLPARHGAKLSNIRESASIEESLAMSESVALSAAPLARPLSPYEAARVREIAAWKSLRPSRLAEAVSTLTAPVTWVVGHFIPRKVVTKLVTSMESLAHRVDSVREVKKAAGVADIRELAGGRLEECDALASLFSARAERFAMVESAASGFGGPLFHIPAQLVAALRSIARIGHCYGYLLDDAAGKAATIDILEIATLEDPEERKRVIELLHDAIDRHLENFTGAEDLLQKTSRNMIAEEVVDLIPTVGTAVSFLFDSQFMHSVDEAAKRVFQERWLRDHGLVESIPPSPVEVRRSSLEEFGLALGQGLYCVGALMGFTASVPGRLVQHAVGRGRNPVSLGARHGSDRAVSDAREFLAGLRSSYEDPAVELRGEPQPVA
jgi:hypothetical protein